MHTILSAKFSLFTRVLYFAAIFIFLSLYAHNPLNAEEAEIEIEKIDLSTISWGRKYFFDAPRFKEHNVQDLLDSAILETLNSYGIQVSEEISGIQYVLNYTVILEGNASQTEIEELYIQEPELKSSSNDTLNFEQGKFLISIRDRDTRKAIWKNSIEGLANLDMPEEIRQKRVIAIVEQAFSTFPNEYKYSQ